MTGENLEELASRHGKDTKKKEEETPKPPESEFSELSDTSKTDEKVQQRPEAEKESKQEEDKEADEVPHRKKLKSFVPVDRAKFGRHIVTYGTDLSSIIEFHRCFTGCPTQMLTKGSACILQIVQSLSKINSDSKTKRKCLSKHALKHRR